jgi:hypothetical protein
MEEHPMLRLPARSLLRTLTGVAAAGFLATAAAAHHGWAWTEDEPFLLTGVIESIFIGNPHVTMEVRADGLLWHVDLAPLGPTLQAGFSENAAGVGDEVTLIGYRSRTHDDHSMKAARVIVNGATYDVYPSRVPSVLPGI